jgi:hypothetical protein
VNLLLISNCYCFRNLFSISVEAMKKVVFSNLEEIEVEEETFHTWYITDWKTLSKTEYGPIFECGGHHWCVDLLQASIS